MRTITSIAFEKHAQPSKNTHQKTKGRRANPGILHWSLCSLETQKGHYICWNQHFGDLETLGNSSRVELHREPLGMVLKAFAWVFQKSLRVLESAWPPLGTLDPLALPGSPLTLEKQTERERGIYIYIYIYRTDYLV